VLILLLAPESRKLWSESHGIGISAPQGWKILHRDRGETSIVIEGPQLGQGVPHVELRRVASADGGDLATVTTKLVEGVTKRPGWRVTARVRKRIGPWPAERIGLAFTTEGGLKGRARFTVALIGAHYFVLEMSGAANGFPAGAFDRMEQSLETRWSKRELTGLGRIEVPAAWTVTGEGAKLEVVAPALGGVHCSMRISPAPEGPPRVDGTRPGPKLKLLGKSRETLETKEPVEGDVRAVLVRAEGWQVVLFLSDATREDLLPVFQEILARARKAKP